MTTVGATSSTPRPQPPLTMIAHSEEGGDVIGNEHGFFTVHNAGGINTFTNAGEHVGTSTALANSYHSTVGNCQVFVVNNGDDVPNILVYSRNTIAPQGVVDERSEYFVTLYNGRSFTQIWRQKLYETSGFDQTSCGLKPSWNITEDTRWAVINGMSMTRPGEGAMYIVDTASGSSKVIEQASAAAAGNFIITESYTNDISVLDPSTLAPIRTAAYTNGGSTDYSNLGSIVGNGINTAFDATRVVMTSTTTFSVLDVRTGAVSSSAIDHDGNSYRYAIDAPSNSAYVTTDDGIAALDLATMQQKWSAPARFSSFCGASRDQVLVTTQRQDALLSAKDGSQITYSDELNQCGAIFGDYMVLSTFTDGTSVYQAFGGKP
ncbi:hypothetical protein [Rhodococcoides kroppenstedtii]|uniref:hypothetical protein n=1 Tax=Rhodococcoides kroppenstedtii TaxID=293050 RepID=UPI00362805E8